MLRYLLSLMALASPLLAAAETFTPQFDQYRVAVSKISRPHSLVKRTPLAKKFKTAISEGMASGPNFAGKYSFVTWGCGTGCSQVAIVDIETGVPYFPPELEYVNSDPVATGLPLDVPAFQFDIGSNLLVVSGMMPPYEKAGIKYFLWRNEKLELLKFVHK